jgi:murein DD-endopeptidase MepM/ murein hydrolase activator NlpD
MDDRRLILIVVPHGDLETHSFEISYRKLKVALGLATAAALVLVFVLASLFPVLAQAGRVPALERDLARLEQERAKVTELAQTLAEVEAQYERVRQLLGADQPEGATGTPMLPPLRTDSAPRPEAQDGDIGSDGVSAWPLAFPGFITRTQQTGGRTSHPGLDIAVPMSSYIRASGPGVVTKAGTDAVYGEFVLIDHGSGLETLYGHASRLLVKPGDRVNRHEVIALSGSSGQSSAPHLHFEVRLDGKPVDPLTYVRQP